jgi:hypothetical protein
MRMTFQKPQWDHTVTGRKGRTSGKAAGAPDRPLSWRKAHPAPGNAPVKPAWPS